MSVHEEHIWDDLLEQDIELDRLTCDTGYRSNESTTSTTPSEFLDYAEYVQSDEFLDSDPLTAMVELRKWVQEYGDEQIQGVWENYSHVIDEAIEKKDDAYLMLLKRNAYRPKQFEVALKLIQKIGYDHDRNLLKNLSNKKGSMSRLIKLAQRNQEISPEEIPQHLIYLATEAAARFVADPANSKGKRRIKQIAGNGMFTSKCLSVTAVNGIVGMISANNRTYERAYETLRMAFTGKDSELLFIVLNKDLNELRRYMDLNPEWLHPLIARPCKKAEDDCIIEINHLKDKEYQWVKQN